MLSLKAGTIINVTSVTGLEVPPFTGEAVYHSNKAAQEGFTNSLRNELCGTNIRVLALRPGVVAGHFHAQRVGNDQAQYDEFLKGYTYASHSVQGNGTALLTKLQAPSC